MALYSTLAVDLATTCCFLLFEDIKLPSIETQYPEVDLLFDGDPAQSASIEHTTPVWSLLPYSRLFLGEPLMYFNIRVTALK